MPAGIKPHQKAISKPHNTEAPHLLHQQNVQSPRKVPTKKWPELEALASPALVCTAHSQPHHQQQYELVLTAYDCPLAFSTRQMASRTTAPAGPVPGDRCHLGAWRGEKQGGGRAIAFLHFFRPGQSGLLQMSMKMRINELCN